MKSFLATFLTPVVFDGNCCGLEDNETFSRKDQNYGLENFHSKLKKNQLSKIVNVISDYLSSNGINKKKNKDGSKENDSFA